METLQRTHMMHIANRAIVTRVKESLTDDLLKPGYSGHCYIASEAIYHLLGGKDAGLTPMNIKHEGVQHWFLKMDNHLGMGHEIIDVTANQFKTPVPYDQAKGRGFLTILPSKRASILMSRAMNDETINRLEILDG